MIDETRINKVFAEMEMALFESTEKLDILLTETSYSEKILYELELSKAYSNYVSLKSFILCNSEFEHHEVISLISQWEKLFLQMEEVVKDKEKRNQSWLIGAYDRYHYQHEVVSQMIK